ncbi:MAG TPA: aromatic ring-hydroxylating dioxygenase subunit alpha [Candidatus Methylomirabilis sp.]|nr:aromatic ring-hydroxylating dioxygenase subunit alpha [Candidatus Methylomirabilis sp.]
MNVRDVQQALEATRAPLNRASNLPAFCYTSPEWYAREIEQIFRKEWIYVGHRGQLARAGDYFTAQIGDEPILIVRGEDGQTRAFSNVCRHRASLVAAGEGQCRAFVCPYHRWTYGLCGELLGTPGRRDPMNEAEGFDPAQNGLLRVGLETWGGFLFVNFDEAAPPLLSWLGDLPLKLGNYKLEEMVVTRRVSWSVDCNWKVFMENSIEEYHVETLHRKHLPRDNPNLVVVEESRGPFALRFTPASITAKGSPFPPMPGLSEKERTGTYPLALFPNTNLIVGNHFAKVLQHLPNAVERCTMTLSFLFPPEVVSQPEFAAYSDQSYRYTDELLAEDTSISPQVQQGLRSRLRRPGRFSKQEGAVHAFQNYVLGRVLAADEGRPTPAENR